MAIAGKIYRALLRFFEKYYGFFFAAGVLVLAFYCFRCLDVKYVDSWDEARHGVNAYEMIQNGDYIRHTYNYQVDDWNLKPSISYWAIVLGFRLFGYSVWGLRFFSALAYLLTGVLCACSRSGGAGRRPCWYWASSAPMSGPCRHIWPGPGMRIACIFYSLQWRFWPCFW